jgi:hypothetical protein
MLVVMLLQRKEQQQIEHLSLACVLVNVVRGGARQSARRGQGYVLLRPLPSTTCSHLCSSNAAARPPTTSQQTIEQRP